MGISYKKLWKLLIDLDLKKKDLPALAGISSASVTKLGKNENINTEILEKICIALDCDISDIMEMAEKSSSMGEQPAGLNRRAVKSPDRAIPVENCQGSKTSDQPPRSE